MGWGETLSRVYPPSLALPHKGGGKFGKGMDFMGLYTVLMVVHSIIVLFLIMMILIQRTDSDGMGGLSGGGGNQFLTGRATANLMTRTTAILAGAFMVSSLLLAVLANRMTNHSIVDAVPASAIEETKDAPKPAEAPAVKKSAPSVPKPE